jgi:hypothetical protein
MANKEYCIHCGHKNIFESSRPKFCAGCGLSFNLAGSSNSSASDSEEEDSTPLKINLHALRKSIQVETPQAPKVTLDNLWSDPAPRSEGNFREGDDSPVGQALLKQVLNECMSSKEPKSVDE